MLKRILLALVRFFVTATGGYTTYSMYPDWDKQFEEELRKIRQERAPK